ncbi:ABC transporter permease [Knoellia aerolata]|uniref:ABC transporter permease n=1 Tax=Knoellia aerolata DSM 18566 TaxID=1385519 RepID=A0A0A0JU58_9MICO|nr:ABC transporter permease [Knoellia aerolata]KGN40920.1 ABC transporter permease [Knoellia aerolata DSM 18566]
MSTDKQVVDSERENEFTTTHHVYVPHKAGIPPLANYARELWRRREFATEMSRASLRAANTLTLFGQVWLVLNPLLLSGVYFLLVQVLSGGRHGWEFFAQLTAGLFTFYFISGSMGTGASSVVGGGKLLLNTAFPRLLMPFSAIRTAFFRFLPTLPVYLIFHVIAGLGFHWAVFIAVFFLFLLVVFALGLAALFATLQVYFRDTTSFLPYLTRIWLYASPVLWSIETIPPRFEKVITVLEFVNPLHSLLGGFTQCLVNGDIPSFTTFATATVWAFGVFAIGSLFFMSREREFAVRL